ncbi:hypothetical protein HMPREF6123_2595 [Oribacterium sinus F0268]|uniref:Uncharacterized protein n=1 Tax=Oribacterium sinus F0268 TaxID=585501 RepID=C2L1H6_9FIRM|nr:hypothetical protein HMPREF6123_2595 [Oribacterium sinus F0268]
MVGILSYGTHIFQHIASFTTAYFRKKQSISKNKQVKNTLYREKPFYKENFVIFSKKIRGCKNLF